MQKTIAQSEAVLGRIVLAADAEAGDQRMIAAVPIVSVVDDPLLRAAAGDEEAVNVDGDGGRAAVGAGAAEPPLRPVGQAVAEGLQILGAARQDVDQPRLRGLAGQPLVEGAAIVSIPAGQAEGRIVSQAVEIVLSGVTKCQRVDPFAEQFQERVTDAVLTPRIVKLAGERLAQPQPVIGFPQQDHPAIGREPFVGRRDLDGPLKSRLQKPRMSFTHRVILLVCGTSL